jgi:hypothetical protein
MPRKVISLAGVRRRKKKEEARKKISWFFPKGRVAAKRLPPPFNSPVFPGFAKLDSTEMLSIIRVSIRKCLRRTSQDPWEPFITNPPKPKRLSHEERLQKAWEEYRGMLLFLMQLGWDGKFKK